MTFRKRLARAINRRLDPPPPHKGPHTVLLSGKILVRDDFLPSEDFIALQRWAVSVPTPKTRKDREWQQLLVRDFGENKGSRQWASDHDDVPEEAQPFVKALREAEIIAKDDLLHFGVYRWERLSGMGIHTDAHTDTAITFYLNDVWEKNWGGDFTYYESPSDLEIGIGHTVSPAANRLVVNHSTIDHKVNYCSTTAQDRLTLQAFVYKGKDH
ncbi:MAG: 2OG-Fe(II) oxygenase [Gammaproteobacteria bacterium]